MPIVCNLKWIKYFVIYLFVNVMALWVEIQNTAKILDL